MPKKKTYEYDYEWGGQEEKSKGVNIQERNPWSKPTFASMPTKTNGGQSSYDTQPDRFQMDELKRRHQWKTPNWATAKGKESNKEILNDPIPKPMLKQTSGACTAGGIGSPSNSGGKRGGQKSPMTAEEKEIAEMERKIADAKRKKAELIKMQEDEAERLKHTIEETKVEKARRLAKEREDARWRATLAERNERDRLAREQARLASAVATPSSSDATWSKTQDEQKQRYEERVQAERRQRAEQERQLPHTVEQHEERSMSKRQEKERRQEKEGTDQDEAYATIRCIEDYEIVEEDITEEYEEEEYVEETEVVSVLEADLQRQIEELQKQLAAA